MAESSCIQANSFTGLKYKCNSRQIETVADWSWSIQAFTEACENNADRKLLGAFIKWVANDLIKEESDTLADNGLTMKDVGGTMSKKAKIWFFSKEEL